MEVICIIVLLQIEQAVPETSAAMKIEYSKTPVLFGLLALLVSTMMLMLTGLSMKSTAQIVLVTGSLVLWWWNLLLKFHKNEAGVATDDD